MYRYLYILFFLLLSGTVLSQQSRKSTIDFIDSLLDCSHHYYVNVEILSSMENAIEAKSLSEEHNYSKGKARSNFYIAQVLSSMGDYNQALEYISLAENEKYTSNNPLFYSEVSRIHGRILGMLGMYNSAIRVLNKGMYYINQIKDTGDYIYLQSMAYDNISAMFFGLKEMDSVVHYLDKNQELLNAVNDSLIYRNLINVYSWYGKVYVAEEKYDTATYYLDMALALADEYQFPYTANIYNNIGDLEVKRGNYQLALDNYRKGLVNQKETGIKQGLVSVYQSMADVCQQIGKTDSSQYYLRQKAELEKELEATNVNALDKAVQALLEEERGQSISRMNEVLSIVAVIVLFLIFLAVLLSYLWRKKNKAIIAEKDSTVAELEDKLSDAAIQVIELAKNNDDAFLTRFNELYTDFVNNIYEKHPNITNSEYHFIALIHLHFSSKEIAHILYIEHRSVQTRKGRLRKKLGLSPQTDLYQYLKSFDDKPVIE